MKLNACQVEAAKLNEKFYQLTDVRGLYLEISASGQNTGAINGDGKKL
ncbi:putative phage integrase [Yersinia frederiksenii]|uniref:Uncharacterized protein n=2 Tax=Yersinia frederiksenii TaxID=29484 RepID=A0ABR4W3D9_YERFR|nr:hypothetical protein yfred0001_25460 [Yersinia frederiksenii ATCC 33641]KGA46860.1 hypothetical protein DJ58_480 [Yersinia frederiksenii ATCC 33641]CNF72917.1 putative phage integrase [Yersinia frederiksenii]SUP77619.1 putative phage integrase [Yersinia frederiksenii]